MSEINTHAGNLRLIGGRLCLDFINTVDDYRRPQPKEHLRTYGDLLRWAVHRALLDASAAAHLLARSEAQPALAQAALSEAQQLRQALFVLFIHSEQPRLEPDVALDTLNATLLRAPARVPLRADAGVIAWRVGSDAALAAMLAPIAWSASELLTSPEAGRVRCCAGEGCGWVFLDTSRSGRRRWCSMEDCGNRAKARRYYARSQN